MSSAVAVREAPQAGTLARYDPEQVKVLKTLVTYKDISDTELDYYLTVAERIGLDPFAVPREIYAIPRKAGKDSNDKKLTIHISVDGAVKLATKHGDLEWIGPVEFHIQTQSGWKWTDMWLPGTPITHARVTIKRKSSDKELTFVIRKGAYEVENNPFWKSSPDQMLAAAVVRHALKRSGAIYATAIPPELRSVVGTEEPRFDPDTGEMLCTSQTRQALHSGHNHAEVHAVAVEVAGVETVAELTEEQAQEVLEVLNTPEATGQTTIVEMGKPASRDRKEEV